MADPQDIDRLLRHWPFEAGMISARLVPAEDGREVLQMRIEMGVLQMETCGRPDGEQPGGPPRIWTFSGPRRHGSPSRCG